MQAKSDRDDGGKNDLFASIIGTEDISCFYLGNKPLMELHTIPAVVKHCAESKRDIEEIKGKKAAGN